MSQPQTDKATVTASQTDSPAQMVLRMITGLWASRTIAVIAQLGVADLVKSGPKSAEEIAAETGSHPPSLYRLLRAATVIGLLTEDDDQRFGPTALSAVLETSNPASLRSFASMLGSGEHYEAWGELLHGVQTGEMPFTRRFGSDAWTYFRTHPEEERRFQNGLRGVTRVLEEDLLSAYDFSPFKTVVDVAGGHGSLLAAVLKAHPDMKGVLFDTPHVIEAVRAGFDKNGVSDRCRLIGGDFFSSIPRGGDLYMLKWIIHDWNDRDSVRILSNCRTSMGRGSRLLLVEAVVSPPNEPSFAKLSDLNMLVMTGGKERTELEYRALLEASGFRLISIIPTGMQLSIVEAAPVVLR